MIFKTLGKYLDLLLYISVALLILDVAGIIDITQFIADSVFAVLDYMWTQAIELVRELLTNLAQKVVPW
jgi:hypothetical protein